MEGLQSEFNYGVPFTNRLNYSFWIINETRRNLDISGWYKELLILRAEISDDVRKIKIEQWKRINDLKDSAHPLVQSFRGGDVPIILYDRLDALEIEIRQAIKDAGYKTKYSSDPSQAMG
mgnify:CR=1 FL=1